MSDPTKPYDDKAAESLLANVRLNGSKHGMFVPALCDHLDSARAEIARLTGELARVEAGSDEMTNAELRRCEETAQEMIRTGGSERGEVLAGFVIDLVAALRVARIELDATTQSNAHEIARLRQLCGEAANKIDDEIRRRGNADTHPLADLSDQLRQTAQRLREILVEAESGCLGARSLASLVRNMIENLETCVVEKGARGAE